MDITEAKDINKKRWWSWKPLQIGDNKWTDTCQGKTRHVLITGAERIPTKYSSCKGPKGIILEFSRNRKKGSVWLKCDGEGHIGRQWGWRGELSFQNATLAMCFHIVYGYMDATRAELSNILGLPKSSFGFSMLWKNLNKKNPSELFGQPNATADW